jgi:hypothetical protein
MTASTSFSPDESSNFQECKRCGTNKPLSAYYRIGATSHEKTCKICRDEVWYEKHPEFKKPEPKAPKVTASEPETTPKKLVKKVSKKKDQKSTKEPEPAAPAETTPKKKSAKRVKK